MADERTGNEQLLDSQILWQILLLRYSLHVRARVLEIVNGTEVDVATQIRGALAVEPGMRDPAKLAELNRLVDRLEVVRRQAWEQGAQVAQDELTNLGRVENERQSEVYGAWLPDIRKPAWVALAGFAVSSPFQGRSFRQWFADAAQDDAKRIRTAIFDGVGRSERPDDIARRVVGSARAKGGDGVTQISRNHIDAIVRSGILHVAARVRDQFFQANAATLLNEQYLAVLDSRTTQICRRLNGNRYRVGQGPMPPMHINCRSIRYAVLPRWAGGPVPEPEVYENWLRRQSADVRLELLGATRAARMRAGTFDATRFSDYGSKAMTLDEVLAAARRLSGIGI